MKQESHRHQYGNGKVNIQAVHQRTMHLPTLQVPNLARNHTHLQHIPPKPEPLGPRRPYRKMPPIPHTTEHTITPSPSNISPVCSRHGQPSAHPRAPGEAESPPLPLGAMPRVRPNPPPETTHPAPQRATTTPHKGRPVARPQAHPRPEHHTRCPCNHTTPEIWEHFKICPLHTGRDTLVGWSPAETLQQHEGWPAHSHAHQATEHLFKDPLIKEATMEGAVTQALEQHLIKHAKEPMGAAAHLQLEAVRRAAANMVHRKRLLLTHTEQLADQTAREHMLRLVHYHAVHDAEVH